MLERIRKLFDPEKAEANAIYAELHGDIKQFLEAEKTPKTKALSRLKAFSMADTADREPWFYEGKGYWEAVINIESIKEQESKEITVRLVAYEGADIKNAKKTCIWVEEENLCMVMDKRGGKLLAVKSGATRPIFIEAVRANFPIGMAKFFREAFDVSKEISSGKKP